MGWPGVGIGLVSTVKRRASRMGKSYNEWLKDASDLKCRIHDAVQLWLSKRENALSVVESVGFATDWGTRDFQEYRGGKQVLVKTQITCKLDDPRFEVEFSGKGRNYGYVDCYIGSSVFHTTEDGETKDVSDFTNCPAYIIEIKPKLTNPFEALRQLKAYKARAQKYWPRRMRGQLILILASFSFPEGFEAICMREEIWTFTLPREAFPDHTV